MSDEAHFHLSGTVNRHNCRVWAAENPHPTAERAPPEDPYVTAWCGICSRGILGPYFFERAGRRVSFTGAAYHDLLRKHVVPALQDLAVPFEKVWFQQDGATPHTTTAVLEYLQQIFPRKLISRGGDISWPPHPTAALQGLPATERSTSGKRSYLGVTTPLAIFRTCPFSIFPGLLLLLSNTARLPTATKPPCVC